MIFPLYLPTGNKSYEVYVRGQVFAELFIGKSGWFVVTDQGFGRFMSAVDAEARIDRAIARCTSTQPQSTY